MNRLSAGSTVAMNHIIAHIWGELLTDACILQEKYLTVT